jgi:hypothetical protein
MRENHRTPFICRVFSTTTVKSRTYTRYGESCYFAVNNQQKIRNEFLGLSARVIRITAAFFQRDRQLLLRSAADVRAGVNARGT